MYNNIFQLQVLQQNDDNWLCMSQIYTCRQVPLKCAPIYHVIVYNTAITEVEYEWDSELTKDTSHLTLMGELWGVSCEYFVKIWLYYNSTVLYVYVYIYIHVYIYICVFRYSEFWNMPRTCPSRLYCHLCTSFSDSNLFMPCKCKTKSWITSPFMLLLLWLEPP